MRIRRCQTLASRERHLRQGRWSFVFMDRRDRPVNDRSIICHRPSSIIYVPDRSPILVGFDGSCLSGLVG